MIQVLGAIAYGEQKAHELAAEKVRASTTEDERLVWRKTAAEELRHYKGFVRRLEALGADPERAMAPYQGALDHYHGATARTEIQGAVWDYLGEGIANDLLAWLRQVADSETATFITGVLADEEDHEAHAAEELRVLLGAAPGTRAEAVRAAREMLVHMISSGGSSIVQFSAFLRVGEPHQLVGRLISGFVARLRAIGITPGHLFMAPSLGRTLQGAS